jgi:hypothetical protein
MLRSSSSTQLGGVRPDRTYCDDVLDSARRNDTFTELCLEDFDDVLTKMGEVVNGKCFSRLCESGRKCIRIRIFDGKV